MVKEGACQRFIEAGSLYREIKIYSWMAIVPGEFQDWCDPLLERLGQNSVVGASDGRILCKEL